MLFAFGNDGTQVNREYHEVRLEALRSTVSLDEWGPIDIERYDLDDLPDTLGGPMYQRQYRIQGNDGGEIDGGPFDIRDLPTHD